MRLPFFKTQLTPEVQKILEDLSKSAPADDKDNIEEGPTSFFPFPLQEENELERRGILVIDKDITKRNIAEVTNKLLTFQFDEKFNDEVQIILNSPGGYLDAAWAFIDIIESTRLKIRTVAIGEICSAAVMIFITGQTRVMAPNSVAMIHHFSSFSAGNYPDLLAARKAEDLQTKKIINHFIRHSKYRTKKQITSNLLLTNDNWLSPNEMKKHGLCDSIIRPKRLLAHRK